MKAKLTLNSPIWETSRRRAILKRVLQQSAEELEKAVKDRIETGIPSGRLYRRGAITARATKANLRSGFLKVKKTRVSVGMRIHRASAFGQAPATDSGKLLRSITVKQSGELQITIFSDLRYAEILDNPNKLNRPFMKISRDNYRRKFKQNLRDAIINEIKS